MSGIVFSSCLLTSGRQLPYGYFVYLYLRARISGVLHGSEQVNCLVISHFKTQVVCLLIYSLYLASQRKLPMPDLLQSCTVGWEGVSQAKPEKQERFWSTVHEAKQLLVFGLCEIRPGGIEQHGHELFGSTG